MPRQARLDKPGTLHHAIIRGIEKADIFRDDEDRENFIGRMEKLVLDTDTQIFAWALMTNHCHLLLKSGAFGLSRFMRRLLTGYAVSHNLRHSRHGHLFHNRYKSILCEEDSYFLELVRYIHLNPLRAGMIKDLSQLDRYLWCGHSVIMGKVKREWQDQGYVLKFFGKKASVSQKTYRAYVKKGIGEGARPDLVGGGLVRSMGGWSNVVSMRRHGEKEASDPRILGSGKFVERVIQEAEVTARRQFREKVRAGEIEKEIAEMCRKAGISIQEIRTGSRRRPVTVLRFQIAKKLFTEYGLPMAEIARKTGVTTSAVVRRLSRSA